MRARTTLSVLLLVGVTSWVLPARSQVCKGAMALRVNDKGLQFIGQQVKPLVPDKLTLPAVNAVVVDWPLTESDATVNFNWGTAALKLKDLQLSMEDKAVRVLGRANVDTGGPLTVDNPYVGLGTANCEANIKIRDLEIDLRLYLDDEGGKVNADVLKAKITIDNDNTVIALTGCTLGKILTKVLDFLRKYFMGTIEKKIESLAKEKIKPLIESKLAGTIQLSKEVQGFVFTGRLDGVRTDDRGVAVDLGAGIHLKTLAQPPCLAGQDLSAPKTCGNGTALLSTSVDAMFGAGLSEGVIDNSLNAVWRSGMLCIDSNDPKLAQSLGPGLDLVATKLGQPKGTKLAFSLRLLAPPRLKLSAGGGVELAVNKFLLRLSMQPPGGPLNQSLISADLAIAAKPWIDPAGNTIALDLDRVTIARLEVQNADGTPAELKLDPARLQRFITTVAMPVLRKRLASMPLSPAVMNVQSYQVELKSVLVGNANLAAYINAYQLKPTGDKNPPQTVLVQSPGQAVGPEVIRILVRGTDNKTPAGLLRFKWRVDGGAWSEPSYGGRVDVTTYGGAHLVEIAALDHDGNLDPTPLQLPLRVDTNMPQLIVTEQPEHLLETGSATVSFIARDDRTPAERLVYTAQLYRVPDGGGNPALLQSRILKPGQLSVTFADLADGVYNIRVIVADGVGNVTSQDVGFVVAAEGGCSLAPTGSGGGPGAPVGLLVLALAAMLFIARRRDG